MLSIFDHCEGLAPEENLELFLRRLPARWVIYLMADGQDRPVQLLCVRNLRASLKHRLGEIEPAGPSRKIDYRQIVRRIYWCRVDSPFEADWLYLQAARDLFPQTYQGMVGFRPAWFIHVDLDAPFPRYVKTTDLAKSGELIGPVEDKHAAARLIEEAQDLFDLCRYYNILVDAPNAKACAYKEMGRCPAPCDGSISMEQYRRLIAWSADILVNPAEMALDQQRRMAAAAAERRFELAAKIKTFADRLAHLTKGPWRHLCRLRDFAHLSFQHGPKVGQVKVFLITPGRMDQILSLIDAPERGGEILRVALTEAAAWRNLPIDTPAAERIAIAAQHLFQAKSAHGVFIPLDRIDEPSILRGYRELQKRKINADPEGEGVMKELQDIDLPG